MIRRKSKPLQAGLFIHGCFTLIEMLVVIAIIGILASLLMPSLHKALDVSRRISCCNNLRNMYLGFASYTNTNMGWLPYRASIDMTQTGYQNSYLEHILAPYMDIQTDGNNPYFPVNSNIFICPSSPISCVFDGAYNRYFHAGVRYDSVNAYEGMFYNWRNSSAYIGSEPTEKDSSYLRLNSYRHPTQMPYQFCSRRESPVEKLTCMGTGDISNHILGAASWHGDSSMNCPRPTLFFDGHTKILTQYEYIAHGEQNIIKFDTANKPDVMCTEY